MVRCGRHRECPLGAAFIRFRHTTALRSPPSCQPEATLGTGGPSAVATTVKSDVVMSRAVEIRTFDIALHRARQSHWFGKRRVLGRRSHDSADSTLFGQLADMIQHAFARFLCRTDHLLSTCPTLAMSQSSAMHPSKMRALSSAAASSTNALLQQKATPTS